MVSFDFTEAARMQLNLGTILAASAEARPDHPAILFGERQVRFSELDRQARGVAGALRERGIGPGLSAFC